MNKYLIGESYPFQLVSDEVPAGDATQVSWAIKRVHPVDTDNSTSQIGTVAAPDFAYALPTDATQVGIKSIWSLTYVVDGPAGTHTITDQFFITAAETLIPGVNSFQTYWGALMLADDIPGIDSFKEASKDDQLAALINAYRSIGTLTFADKCKVYPNITSLTGEELATLSPDLLEALSIAQIIEANESLDTNSVHYKRMDGLMSETIGESSMMFRSGKVANNTVVTKRSMGFLRNYLVVTVRISRA